MEIKKMLRPRKWNIALFIVIFLLVPWPVFLLSVGPAVVGFDRSPDLVAMPVISAAIAVTNILRYTEGISLLISLSILIVYLLISYVLASFIAYRRGK